MKSYHADSGAGLAGLTLKEHDDPPVGPREILIRVRANSLNFREISVLRGTYPLPVKPDVVMGADGAGEVIECGPGVTRVRTGDRVAVAMFPRWIDGPIDWEYAPQIGGTLDGMLTELVAIHEDGVVKIPEHLSFEEGATLPCAAVTAWNALTGGRCLQAGDTVLTQGTGGVSLFAVQIARLFGARVIATTSSDEKAERLKSLGAHDVINYARVPEWHRAVRELTKGRGVDHVVDILGGSLEQSIRSVALGGQIHYVGRVAGAEGAIDSKLLYGAVATIRVVFAGSRGHFLAMNRAIAANRLRPVIDRVFSFGETIDAFRYLESERPFGKVVITHAETTPRRGTGVRTTVT